MMFKEEDKKESQMQEQRALNDFESEIQRMELEVEELQARSQRVDLEEEKTRQMMFKEIKQRQKLLHKASTRLGRIKSDAPNQTTIFLFNPVQRFLNLHLRWYYKWHINPAVNRIHWSGFLMFLLAMIGGTYFFYGGIIKEEVAKLAMTTETPNVQTISEIGAKADQVEPLPTDDKAEKEVRTENTVAFFSNKDTKDAEVKLGVRNIQGQSFLLGFSYVEQKSVSGVIPDSDQGSMDSRFRGNDKGGGNDSGGRVAAATTTEVKRDETDKSQVTMKINDNLSLVYRSTEKELKEDIIVNSKDAFSPCHSELVSESEIPNQVRDDGNRCLSFSLDPNFQYLFDEKTKNINVYAKDDKDKKELLFIFNAPNIKDKNGTPGKIAQGLSLNEGQSFAEIAVDPEFIKTAVYPLIIDPTVTIATSTTATPLSYSKDRTLWEASSGTVISIHTNSDDTGLAYQTSTDNGKTWGSATAIGGDGSTDDNGFSTYLDTSNNIHVIYSDAGSAHIYYRKLTYTASPESWSVGAEKTVESAGTTQAFPTITVTSANVIWAGYRYYDASDYTIRVKSSSDSGDNWSSSSTLSAATNASADTYPSCILWNDKPACIYNFANTTIRWNYYNGSAWQAAGWANEVVSSTVFATMNQEFSAMETSDHYIHLVWRSGFGAESEFLAYKMNTNGTANWQADGSNKYFGSTRRYPTIGRTSTNYIRVYYVYGAGTVYYIDKNGSNGEWANVTNWVGTGAATIFSGIQESKTLPTVMTSFVVPGTPNNINYGPTPTGDFRYWRGTADANWNNVNNWSIHSGGTTGASVPSTTDVAIFDSGGNNPCNLNMAPTVAEMYSTTYANAFSAGANALTVSGNFSWFSGTYNGGSLANNFNGNVYVNGGAYTATSGDTIFAATTSNFYHTGGTFSHNNGKFTFSSSQNGQTVVVVANDTFNNIEINKSDQQSVFWTGYTLIVSGTLTLTNGGFGGGTIDLNGTLSSSSTFDGGVGTILIDGAGQTVNISDGWILPNVSLQNGTLNAPSSGTMTFMKGGYIRGASAVFNNNNSTVIFSGGQNGQPINVPTSENFNNLTINNPSATTFITGGNTLIVNGNLSLISANGGISNGTLDTKGSITIGSSFAGGTALINMSGTQNQTYTIAAGGVVPTGDLTINKASGTAYINGNMTAGYFKNINLTSGTLEFQGGTGGGNTYKFYHGNTLTTSAGTNLRFVGDSSNIVTLTYDATSAWNLTVNASGNYFATNINVSYSNANRALHAANSTCGAGNTNWTCDYVTKTWDGGGGNLIWNTDANWNPDGVPSNADQVTLDVASTITTSSNLTFGNLTIGGANATTLKFSNDFASGTGGITVKANSTLEQSNMVQQTMNGSLSVEASGVVTHTANTNYPSPGEQYKVNLKVNGDITDAGSINGDEKGFASGQGPGKGGNNDGGSHGGRGGDYGDDHTVGPTYDSLANPINLGSGANNGGKGGGAVIISTGGTLTVNGTLSVSGAYGWWSCGSGGSVNITAAILAGTTGTISANGGGNGQNSGGGGRISLNGVTTDTFTGTLQANSGSSRSLGGRGYAGTIYLNAAKRSNLVLGGGGNLVSLRLGADDDTHSYTFGTITIQSGGTLEMDGNSSLNSNNGGAATLNVTTLDIQSGTPDGVLKADGLGFGQGQGPGKATTNRNGGSYGGRGGKNAEMDPAGPTYGSLTNPTYLGSGGFAEGSNYPAGGAVIVSASGTVTVNGTLSANGLDVTWLGHGSGGSVNITAGTLTGAGIIRANGGSDLGGGNGAGGGGGRVSLYGVAANNFLGTLQVSGGTSPWGNGNIGYTGTIVLSQSEMTGTATLGSGGNLNSLKIGSDDSNDYTFNNIVINSGGILEIDGNPYKNSPNGGAATINAANITVNNSGVLKADSLGFPVQRGPGYSGTGNSGGSYGGVGGNGGAAYGDASPPNPINLGSGGQAGGGGGALRLKLTGTFTNSGTVSANGQTNVAGNGAGGAINIDANVINSAGGTITANGGAKSGYGGGGGGRIALRAYSTYTGPSTLTANGGAGTPAGTNGSVYINVTPAASALTSPGNGVSNQSQVAAFNFNATDATNCTVAGGGAGTCTPNQIDYLRYKLQLADDSGFTTNLKTFTQGSTAATQTVSNGGLTVTFTNQNREIDGATNTSYDSARNAIATISASTPLIQNHTYYWRVYAIDTTGSPNGGGIDSWDSSEHWSAVSSTYSFTVSALDKAVMTAGSGQAKKAGECSSIFTFETRNNLNETVKLLSDKDFNLSDAGVSGTFYSDVCVTPVSSVTITTGNASQNFYYKNTHSSQTSYTLTAAETPSAGWADATGTININPDILNHFTLTDYPGTTITDNAFTATVTAYDQFNNVKFDYYGSTAKIWFTATTVPPSYPTVLPATATNKYQFVSGDNGTHTFTTGFQIKKVGTHNIYLHNDTYDGLPDVNLSSNNIIVTPGAAFDFVLEQYPYSNPPSWNQYAISGNAWDLGGSQAPYNPKVTVKDRYENIKTDYGAPVWFELLDPDSNPLVAGVDYVFEYDGTIEPKKYPYVPGDAGVHTFTYAYFTSIASGRNMKFRITDANIHHDYNIYVKPLGLDHFGITTAPTPLSYNGTNWDQNIDSKWSSGGSDAAVTVTAYDILGQIKTNYGWDSTDTDHKAGEGYIYFYSPERPATASGNYLSYQEFPGYRNLASSTDTTHCFPFPAADAGIHAFSDPDFFNFYKGGRRKVYVRECITPTSEYTTFKNIKDSLISDPIWDARSLDVSQGMIPSANPPDTIAVVPHVPGSTHTNDQHTNNLNNNFTVGPGDQKLSLSWLNPFDTPSGVDAKIHIYQSDTEFGVYTEVASKQVDGLASQWSSKDITGLNNEQTYWFKLKLGYKRSAGTEILSDYSIAQSGMPKAIAPVDVTAVQLDRTDAQHPGQVRVDYKLRFESTTTFSYFNPANLSWNAVTDSAVSGDKGLLSGNFSDPIPHTTYLNMNTDFDAQYLATSFKTRVNVDVVGQGVSNSESPTMRLDTKDPANTTLVIDATNSTIADLVITATDDSNPMQMRISIAPDFSSGTGWIAYSTTHNSFDITGAAFVYIEFRDMYYNVTGINTEIRPIPQVLRIKDASEIATSDYRLVLIWHDTPTTDHYNIWRSTNGVDYAKVDTTTKNAYVDINLNSTLTYGYKVTSEDVNHNISQPAGPVSSQPGAAPDVTADPAVELFGWKTEFGVRAKVTWNTDQNSDSFVVYSKKELEPGTSTKTKTGADASIAGDVGIVTSHTVWLYNLEPGAKYYFKALSKNEIQIIGFSNVLSFNTPEKVPLILSGMKITDITNKSAIATWSTSKLATTLVEYGQSSSYGQSAKDDALNTAHSLKMDNLTAGTYHLRVKTTDTDENMVISDDYTFEIPPTPSISGVSVSDVTGITATINWSTNINCDSSVEYGKEVAYTGTQGKADSTTVHSVTLIGLDAKTAYHFRARSADQFGNIATSADQSFTTTADTTAPAIQNLKAEISALGSGENIKYQAIISWDTDEPATSQVEYGQGLGGDYPSKSSENLSMNQNHVVILPELKPNNAYHFHVLSADKSGNRGVSEDQTLITPPKEKSLLQLILRSLEDTFSWVTKLKGKFGGILKR